MLSPPSISKTVTTHVMHPHPETVGQNKPFFLICCLPQVFCHSDQNTFPLSFVAVVYLPEVSPQLLAGSFHPSPLHFLLRLHFLFAQGSNLTSDSLGTCLWGHVWNFLGSQDCFEALISQSIWFPAFLRLLPKCSSPPRCPQATLRLTDVIQQGLNLRNQIGGAISFLVCCWDKAL